MVARIRILWADDQVDVARSLAELLQTDASLEFVTDGATALERIRTRTFDLAIVDLQMGPGEWGGLWLLEELGALAAAPPVLVLSGEGSQTETIRALRLGARDYVEKGRAQEDLRSRVETVTQTTVTERRTSLEAGLPMPVALPYRRARTSRSPGSGLRGALAAAEALLRYLSLVGVSVRSLTDTPPILDPKRLRAPSMGVWLSIARTVYASAVGASPRAFAWNEFDRFTKLRNDLAHGGVEPTDAEAERSMVDVLAALDESLPAAVACGALVAAQTMQYDGRTFLLDGLRLHGHSLALERQQSALSAPVLTPSVVVVRGEVAYAMSPLMEFSIVEGGQETLLVFDGFKWNGRMPLDGSEPIRYVDVRTGRRDLRNVAADMAGLLE